MGVMLAAHSWINSFVNEGNPDQAQRPRGSYFWMDPEPRIGTASKSGPSVVVTNVVFR